MIDSLSIDILQNVSPLQKENYLEISALRFQIELIDFNSMSTCLGLFYS